MLLCIYLYTKSKYAQPLSQIIIVCFLLFSTQIIITQLVLGILGALTNTNLAALNFILSSTFIYFSRENLNDTYSLIVQDIKSVNTWIKKTYAPYNTFLYIMLIMVTIWIVLAAYLLPPRAIDDITYHLTTIIEFIKHNKIFILPIEYRPHVTMPLNAEFLFMWPLIFFNNDYSVGVVQYIVALIGIVVIYRFSRLFSINSKISSFVALLFIFTPVVLAQSGAAYIDIIVSIFFLIALYFSTKYYLSGENYYLYLAALSIGLLSGMKYNVLLLALSLQILIIPNAIKSGKKNLIIYITLIIVSGGYWYLRNFIEFGSFFPFIDSILRVSDSKLTNPITIQYLYSVFVEKIRLLFLKDIGIGSLNGGYGINFWAIALPCWVFCLFKSFKINKKKTLFPIYIWLHVFLGFTFLFLSPASRLYYRARYSIFIIALSLIALAYVINYYKNHRIYKNIIIYTCCIFALFSFINLANTEIPSYRVDIPISDRVLTNKDYTKMRYLLFTRMDMAYIWETLDYITYNYEDTFNIYFAMTYKDFATPFYGSKFNNDIWNFGDEFSKPPDALVYQFKKGYPINYLRKKITMDNVLFNPEYQMIDKAGQSFLFINTKYLTQKGTVRNSLLKHYQNYYSEEINIVNNSIRMLEEAIPVVTSSYIGFVLLYFHLTDSINNKIYFVPDNYMNKIIKNKKFSDFYSVNYVPDNYKSNEILKFKIDNAKITIFKNTVE